jgi:hypothetical protein
MNETAAIIGLYGAVDEAVREDPVRRAAVARLLPQYADEKFAWYEDFKEWLGEDRAEAPAEPFPALEDGLLRLGEIRPKARMIPRRLFAIAVAARAHPEMLDVKTDLGGLSIRALAVKGLAEEDDRSRELLELLGDEPRLTEAGKTGPDLDQWWDGVVDVVERQHLLSDVTAMRPRPCSGSVVEVPGHGLAAAFVTDFTTSEVDFDHAVRFLNPVVWKKCRPDFWCEMKELKAPPAPGGAYTYREVVSSDCAQRGAAWFNAETELDFVFWTLPKKGAPEVAITNYQLSAGRPAEGDLIVVDEGSLVVAKTGGGQTPLHITTTKRIEFDHGFSAPALALIMCATGYADTAADLLYCAASNAAAAAKGKKVGADFPGVEPPARASGTRAPRARRARAASAPCEPPPSNLAEMFQNSANIWAGFLRAGAKALEQGGEDLSPTTRARARDRKEC